MKKTWKTRALLAIMLASFSPACGDDAPRDGDDPQAVGPTDTGAGDPVGDVTFQGMDGVGAFDAGVADAGSQDVATAGTDVTLPDTVQPDTVQPDTAEADTAEADTAGPDTADPDTTQGDVAAPDVEPTDTLQPDTAVADATIDAGAPDGGGSDLGQDTGLSADSDVTPDSSDGGVITSPNSCAGRCGDYDSKASCQCDSYCTTAGDCCKDLKTVCGCVGSGCCKTASDCDDKLSCTTDSCDAKGQCAHAAKAGFCAIDGSCVADGATGGSACAVCDAKQDSKQWTLKSAGTACTDGQICTTGDMCDAKGACVGNSKSGCCTSDAACPTTTACQIGSCNKATGACSFSAQAGCCASGVCCDVAGGSALPKASPCGNKAVATEYQCLGAQVQKREALAGCTGTSATTCSTSATNLAWGGWKTIQSCATGQTCTLSSATVAPVCQSPGGGCTKVGDCDDANPCTTDSCTGGKCSNQSQAGCCVFASDCDDGNACTVDTCAKNVCGNVAKVCSAPSACETGVCDPKSGSCSGAVKAGGCKIGGACYSGGAKHATDGCLVCDPGANQSDWSVTAVCTCTTGACCDDKAGRIKINAAQCDDEVQASEYSCSTDGAKVLTRKATRGCTGKSNTCSVSKSNWNWSAWAPSLACGKGSVCEVKDKVVAGQCVSVVVGASCNAAVTNACCTAQGKVAPKSTPCDTPLVKTELKCSVTTPGGQLLERHAVAGCTGASDTCSSAEAYLAWGEWKLKKQCSATEVCGVSSGGVSGACEAAKLCDPKAACCAVTGLPVAKGTVCPSEQSTEFRCASNGLAVEKRTATGACTGDGVTCSATNLKWSAWTTHVACKSTTVCTVGDDGSPGCALAPGVDCKKSDKWEGTPATASSKSIGAYTDASASLILSPTVHLNGPTDKDYLTYQVTDSSPLHEPRVHVEWSAPGAVMVCAYYRCTKAADGKSCANVVCPAGTLSFSNSAVSAATVNGCCATLAKGTIDYAVQTPGSANNSGEVFFNVLNKAPFCQEVGVKLGFGLQVKTQCDPKAACCDAAGNFAKKATKCGVSALETAYQCSSLEAGGNVQVRKSYGGCTGGSSVCSTATANRVWSSWTTATDCTTAQLCVVADASKPGSCVAINDALCKATDKWEGPTKTSESINLGSVADDADAVMVKPLVHLGLSDVDYLKYRVVDDFNAVDPVVDISWAAASEVTVCAYYQCLSGANQTDCAPVQCPAGAQTYVNSAVSGVAPNGCCMTGKTGQLKWEPDAPGLLNFDETGWVFFNVKNKAPVCQHVNVKLNFAGSSKVCGDGKCEAGESSSCPIDCGSCAKICGAKYDAAKMCQCDALCASAGDCCWDKPLVCGG